MSLSQRIYVSCSRATYTHRYRHKALPFRLRYAAYKVLLLLLKHTMYKPVMRWLLSSLVLIRTLHPIVVSTVSTACTVVTSSVCLHVFRAVAGAVPINLLTLHHSASFVISAVCESTVSVLQSTRTADDILCHVSGLNR